MEFFDANYEWPFKGKTQTYLWKYMWKVGINYIIGVGFLTPVEILKWTNSNKINKCIFPYGSYA